MAGKNQVTLTFAGDSKSLERTFDKVGAGAKDMANDFDKAAGDAKRFGDRIDGVGGAVGNTEGKFMGTADVLDGLATTMGFNIDRQIELARGFGDIAGGVENLKGTLSGGINKLSDMAKGLKAGGKAAVLAKVETVKSLAVQSAAHVKAAAQAMASAIRTRAAWLIAMGPAALVVAAVGVAVYLIIKHWDKVKAAASATWGWVRDRFTDIVEFFKNWGPLLLGPIGVVIKYWGDLKDAADKAKTWIVDKFNAVVTFFKDLPDRIGSALSEPFKSIRNAADTAKTWVVDKFNDVVTFLTNLPGRIGDAIVEPFKGIRNAADTAKTWVTNRFDDVVTFFKNIPERIGRALSNVYSKLVTPFQTAYDKAKWLWDQIKSLGGLLGDNRGGSLTTIRDSVRPPKKKHSGGFVPGTPGTEVPIMALAGEYVSPRGRPPAGGNTYNLTVNALDPRTAADLIMRGIDEAERQGYRKFARA